MKIFIDSGNIEHILKYRQMGLIQGVTTNPGVLGRDGISNNPVDLVKKIIEVMEGDYVFLQVLSNESATQLKEAEFLSSLGDNVVVKVIMDCAGLKSIPMMVKAGIQVSATAVNSIGRAIIAAECGAHYIIPYYGFLEDTMEKNTNLVADIAEIYKAQGYTTKMNIYCRRVVDITVCAKSGVWGILMEPDDLERLFHHAQTEVAVNAHRTAWERRYGVTNWLDFKE